MLVAPHLPRESDSRLHLIHDEEDFRLIADLPQGTEELGTEVIVAPFSLNRLDDEGGDVVLVLLYRLLYLSESLVLELDDGVEVFPFEREGDLWIRDARPGEFGEVFRLGRVRVRE